MIDESLSSGLTRTWDDILDDGSGAFALRLEIAGVGKHPVTDTLLEGVSGSTEGESVYPLVEAITWVSGGGVPALVPTADPFGGNDAYIMEDDSAAAFQTYQPSPNPSKIPLTPYRYTVWIKQDLAATTFCQIQLTGLFTPHRIQFNPVNGDTNESTGTLDAITVTLIDGWYKVVMDVPATDNTTAAFVRIIPAAGETASFPTLSSASTGTLTFYGPTVINIYDIHIANITRIGGLNRTGLNIKYEVGLVSRELEAGALNFQLTDSLPDYPITQMFSNQVTRQTFLTTDINTTATTLEVDSTTGWSNGDIVHIGNEAIYIGIVDAGNSRFLGCSRGYLGTIATAHTSLTADGSSGAVYVTDAPMMMLRRDCSLWAYGDGDDFDGPGHLIWRGTVSSGGSLSSDGATWTITANHIADKFRQKMGSGFGEGKIKGIYHSDVSALSFSVALGATSGITLFSPNDIFNVNVIGHHNDPWELAEEINTQCIAGSSAWLTKVGCEVDGAGRLCITYSTDASARAVKVLFQGGGLRESGIVERGHVRPVTQFDMFANPVALHYPREGNEFDLDPTTAVYAVAANTDYKIVHFDGAYPRAATNFDQGLEVALASGGSFPGNRTYVDLPNLNSDLNLIRIKEENDSTFLVEPPLVIGASTATAPSYFEGTGRILGYNSGLYTQTRLWTEETEVDLGLLLSSGGSFIDSLEWLTDNSAEHVGSMPLLTDADLDIADMRIELASAYAGELITNRQYALFDGDLKLSEYYAEEFKLAGMVPTINPTNNKITVRRLRFASQNEEADAEFDTGNVLTDENFPGAILAKEDIRNVATLDTQYDWFEEEHIGRTFTVVFNQSRQALGQAVFKISPYSLDNTSPVQAEIQAVLIKPITIMGAPYLQVEFEAPFLRDVWDLVPGSVIRLESSQAPDLEAGTRGLVASGFVTATNKSLEMGRITIEALVSMKPLRGYTPTARIDSGVKKTSTEFDLLVPLADQRYAPSRFFDYEYFKVGDAVRVEAFNSWDPISAEGTIVSVADTATDREFKVEFATEPAASLQSADFIDTRMRFQDYSGSLMTDAQRSWAFVADLALSGDITWTFLTA